MAVAPPDLELAAAAGRQIGRLHPGQDIEPAGRNEGRVDFGQFTGEAVAEQLGFRLGERGLGSQ
ncbi:hypothetical protein FF80_02208 [Devosia sp. LC5]|nr:hypothetical protein FF80_02208 [Devosia sp. LC5]